MNNFPKLFRSYLHQITEGDDIVSNPPEKDEADINDLIEIISNPQHEDDLALPGPDRAKDANEPSDDPATLYDLGVPNASPPQ
jgi:hypothetical protein